MPHKLPISVLVVTKNEERKITRCLESLRDFEEVVVVDSGSTDKTKFLAEAQGARVVNFWWNGRYPKKRQWCLNQLELANRWVFFVDADEVLTPELVKELKRVFAREQKCAGYFVAGQYIWQGKKLHFGLRNNKLCLFDRRKVEFPMVHDIGLPGMGEMEGHYQPVLKAAYAREHIGQIHAPLAHYAAESEEAWLARHERYAIWERGMNERKAWPKDPSFVRQMLKMFFQSLPFRPALAFLHCYIFKLGILDGRRGLHFARCRYLYYKMISPDILPASTDLGRFAATAR